MPDSHFRKGWSGLLFFSNLFNVFITPVWFAVMLEPIDYYVAPLGLCYLIDILFWIDFYFQARCYYYMQDGVLVTNDLQLWMKFREKYAGHHHTTTPPHHHTTTPPHHHHTSLPPYLRAARRPPFSLHAPPPNHLATTHHHPPHNHPPPTRYNFKKAPITIILEIWCALPLEVAIFIPLFWGGRPLYDWLSVIRCLKVPHPLTLLPNPLTKLPHPLPQGP